MPGFELFDQKEIDAVVDVIQRKMVHRYSFNTVRNGIWRVEEFEQAVAEKMGSRFCLGVSSGSAALYVALKATGIGPGDEVITSPFTFIASVEAILECGAVPVLADIDESLNLNPQAAEECISDRTKAIMPVADVRGQRGYGRLQAPLRGVRAFPLRGQLPGHGSHLQGQARGDLRQVGVPTAWIPTR